MVTLTRPPGSLLHQAFPGAGAKSRFFYWPASVAANPITLETAWTGGGVFVIAPGNELEADILSHAQQLWNLLNPAAGTKILTWKKGVAPSPVYLSFHADNSFWDGRWGSGLLTHTVGTTLSSAENLLIVPAKGAAFSVAVTASGLQFASPTDRDPPFTVMFGGFPMELDWKRPHGELPYSMELLVSDQSDASGSWRFDVHAKAARQFLSTSEPIIRYVAEAGTIPPLPCFDVKAKASELDKTALNAWLHPYVIEPSHTRFEVKRNTALLSHFLDTAGRQVALTTTDSSAFRLLRNPANSGAQMHMSPVGEFVLSFRKTRGRIANGEGAHVMEVMTGTAGTDFVLFGDGSNALPSSIRFVTDQHAFLPVGKSELTSAARTAWIVPSGGQATAYDYVSQPEEAPLFALKDVKGGKNTLTGLADGPGMSFDGAPIAVGLDGKQPAAMPWMPVRTLNTAEVATARIVEKRVLGHTRRRIAALARMAPPVRFNISAPDLRWVVMPQGFSVGLDSANKWIEVVFAVSAGDVNASLKLSRPTTAQGYVERWPVEEALAKSATFLVATRIPDRMPQQGEGPSPATPFEVSLEVARWNVGVKIGAATLTTSESVPFAPPMVLIKLGGKKSVVDQMPAIASWSHADLFNADPVATARDLKKTVEGIHTLATGFTPLFNPPYRITDQARDAYVTLHDKLTDPEWNGVMVFNAASSVNSLPDDVAALGSGVPQGSSVTAFWVPCFGVDLAKVNESAALDGAPPRQMPAVFAGIHFFDEKDLEPGPIDVGLKLKNLDVVLNNSTLQLFIAKAQLRVSTLMGAKAVDSASNRLVRIEGSYQGKSANGKDQYLIRALGEQVIEMDKAVIEQVKITRLELGSRREAEGGSTVVHGRIGLWGEIQFGQSVEEATGAKAVQFENLSISMAKPEGQPATFKFDAGHVAVDWEKPPSGPGWLKDFPLKLSGFTWGGADFSLPDISWPKPLTLPDLGYTNFDFRALMPTLPTGGGLDFGLEFDLHLGSFGGLTDATKLLRSKVMFGWHGFGRIQVPQFAIGFKFEGGSGPLDIGIQGILRLRAKQVILKQYGQGKLLGIGLVEPQLDAFGYQIPKDPSKVEMAVVVESAKPNNMPTWVMVLGKGVSAGPVTLDYLAFGQNINMLDPKATAGISNTADAVARSQAWLEDKFKNGRLDELRPDKPSGKWDLVASGKITSDVADFKLAFLDDVGVYGLRVDAPIKTPWIGMDILYKKLEDDLGVFSIEVDLKGLRNIELGAGSLTLPVFGFEKYSNGNWAFDFGFQGNDFSKAGTFQMLPFLGSASLKLGELSGRSSQFLAAGASSKLLARYARLELKPVYELQTAFRFGFGKQIQQGILSAGASLTIYGIFQGALAKVTQGPATGMQYIKVAGAAGILLEVFGTVNFAIVSAAVAIRAWIETGIIAETWQEIAIYAEAGVSVYVRFVVASFRIFGKRIEIAIHFSFSTWLRIGTTLPMRIGGNEPGLLLPASAGSGPWPDPLSWIPQKVVAGNKLALPLMVSLDVHLDDQGRPVLSPVIALVNPFPQGLPPLPGESIADLVVAAFQWAVRLSLGIAGVDPVDIQLAELRRLQRQMRSPGGLGASRWRIKKPDGTLTQALEEGQVRGFLAQNVEFSLVIAGDAKQHLLGQLGSRAGAALLADHAMPGISMPWLKELCLSADGGRRLIRDYADPSWVQIDEAWEIAVREQLGKGQPAFDPLDPSRNPALAVGALASVQSVQKRSLLDVVLEDWLVALIEGAIHRALQITEAQPGESIKFAALLAALRAAAPGAVAPPAVEVAQHAAAILFHAQRLPAANGGWTSLQALAGLDIPFGKDGIEDSDSAVLIDSAAPWIAGSVSLAFEGVANGGAARALLQQGADEVKAAGITLSVRQSRMTRPLEASVGGALGLATGDGRTRLGALYDLPGALSQLQVRTPGAPPETSLPWHFARLGQQAERRNHLLASHLQSPPLAGPVDAMFVGGTFRFKLRRLYSQAPLANPAVAIDALPPAGLRGIYGLSGGGESARLVLKSWEQALAALAPTQFAVLWNPAGDGKVPDPAAPMGMHRLVEAGVRFFATNLSTEANPDTLALAQAGGAGGSMVADISQAEDVRSFLWKSTLVNAEGFYIQIDSASCAQLVAEIEALLDKTDAVDLPLSWLRPAFAGASASGALHPYESHLFVKEILPDDSSIIVALDNKTDHANSVPPGFVKLEVRRDNPALARRGDDATEFLSRFAFLEWGLKNEQFPALIPLDRNESAALPVDEPADQDAAKTLAEQDPAYFTHTLLLPLMQLAKENRDANGKLKDAAARNPYAAIGADLQRDAVLGLRDESGHRFPFAVTLAYPDGPVRHLYTDALQRLDAYPGVAFKWQAAASGAVCRISMSLTWGMKLDELRRLSNADRDSYVGQFERLAWIVKGPCATTFARLSAGASVLALEKAPANLAAEVVRFAREVSAALRQPPGGAPGQDVQVSLLAAVELKPAEFKRALQAAGEVALFTAQIVIKRDETLCDALLAKHDPAIVHSASSALPAVGQGTRQQWAEFAAAFEAAVKDGSQPAARLLRLQDGTADQSCWLAAPATLQDAVKATRTLTSFAPRPLALQFASGEASLLTSMGLPPPSPLTKAVTEVDLDELAQRSLDMVEAILAPAVSARMCVASPASFNRIIKAKRSIAGWYAQALCAVEKAHAGAPRPEVVRKKFEDMALSDLRHVYRIGAVCDLQRGDVHGTDVEARVYGELTVKAPESDAFEFSKFRIPTGDAASAPLVVLWKGMRRLDSVQGSQLQFAARYLELRWGGGKRDYVPSRWFEILSAQATASTPIRLNAADVTIPLPLRQLPKPVHIYGHEGEASYGAPKSLAEARSWKYRLHCAAPGEQHDSVTFSVRYDAAESASPFNAQGRTLFDVLVTFQHYAAELGASMAKVQRWDMLRLADAPVAECERLANFVADLEQGFATHRVPLTVKRLEEPQVDTLTSSIKRVAAATGLASEGRAARDILKFAIAKAARGNPARTVLVELADATRLLSNGMPAEVGPTGTPIVGPAPTKESKSEYYNQDKAVTGLAGLSGRRLTLDGLDLFLHATAVPEVSATRNEWLGKVEASLDFVYHTSMSSSTRLVPRVRVRNRITLSGRKTIAAHFAAMAADLFGGALQTLSVDTFARLKVPYQAGALDGYSYPVGVMKGRQAGAGGWAALFEQWAAPVQLEVSAKSDGASPAGVAIDISVYAECYAGSRPVLIVDEVWIPWDAIVPAPPAFGLAPPSLERPQELAALVYGMTRDLKLPGRTGPATSLRNAIAALVKAGVPSLNVLAAGALPTVDELKDERLNAAWEDCVEAAVNAQAFASTAATPLMFWSLEPVNLGSARDFSGHAWNGAGSMHFTASDLQVQQVGKALPFGREGDAHSEEAEVALFLVHAAK